MADFTVAGTIAGLDRAAVLRALGSPATVRTTAQPADPVVAAIVATTPGQPLTLARPFG